MERITVTRALAELKLLDSRINNAIMSAKFVDGYKKKDGKTSMMKTPDEAEKGILADYQSITDLISRRTKIKSAVLVSNATTKVTIKGVEYSVVEAIDKKNSIVYSKNLLTKMRHQYANMLTLSQNAQVSLEKQVSEMLTANLSSASKNTKEDYDIIAKPLIEANQINLIDPLNLKEKIEELENDITGFESEVDFTLSESNAKTEIEF